MSKNVVEKILEKHVVSGKFEKGKEIGIRIDQTLTQDATGTMAYLQFEAMGIPKVKTKLSVSYVDHNTLQVGFENADDHKYLQSAARKYGLYFSRPGNGICHQVHLERFGAPGYTLLGSDSHTPTGGGIGMLAIGAGGLDVAVAMGGGPFYLTTPKVVLVNLKGKLSPWVSAKDVILELLRRLSVKGGVGKIFEYGGDGVKTLSIPERATITNMGAELGATTSVFPSDQVTKEFLNAQDRAKDFTEIVPDSDATYDETVEIDLSTLEPMIAQPHSPDNVVKVKDIEGLKVDQVAIGSCTNSSLKDLVTVANALKGKTVHKNLSLAINPGSKQVMEMLAEEGSLQSIIESGARILECVCGPCIGMGQAPNTEGVTIRTFNRNFEGRSGTKSGKVYLASPETAVACAIKGEITDPRSLGKAFEFKQPKKFKVNDSMVIKPDAKASNIDTVKGPNIKSLPAALGLRDNIEGVTLLKVEDNITTDHIIPAGAKILPYRSNIPKISEFLFNAVDKDFYKRAKEHGGGFIIGGSNYGQGSSREHAALGPMFMGVKSVITKSFARIHKANLINFGIIPMTFKNPDDYDKCEKDDHLKISNIKDQIDSGSEIKIENTTKNFTFMALHDLSERQKEIIFEGGLLNYTKERA